LTLAVLVSGLILTCMLAGAVFSAWPGGPVAAILQPSPTTTSTSTVTPTQEPTFTPRPTATQAPSPTPTVGEPQPHQWLARPFDAIDANEPSRFYLYGTTGGGKYRVHRGADFPNAFGTPVFSAGKGRIIVAGNDYRVIHGERVGFYGQLVVLQLEQLYHGQKVYVLYGHLSKVHVRFLQEVSEGDLIGEVGMTGVAIGPHLHLEVRVGENSYECTRNPELWLRPLPDKGTVVGLLADGQGQPIPEQSLTLYPGDTPDRRWQDATTYSSSEVNPDDEWRENFAVGGVPAGQYIIKTYVNGHLRTKEFTVGQGEIVSVTIEAP
jgi:murein DD-endopeptidase MepM/ murein hydrolase activator NlpD